MPTPPPQPLREQIIAALLTRYSATYALDWSEDDNDLPATIVQDDADTADMRYDMIIATMSVSVARAEIATGTTTTAARQQAHNALSTLITTMYIDPTLGGIATGAAYTGGGINIEGTKYIFAQANFNMTYRHSITDTTTPV